MKSDNELKEIVRRKYSEIAGQDKADNQAACCGASACSIEVNNIMTDDYTGIDGYNQEADLGLGCGLPTQFAKIKKGDIVIDLGSGAGNDCFIARSETGDTGKVIGIDFTPAMIQRARLNAERKNLNNVEFREGDIDHLPVSDSVADVVVSNCVLNLVPDKQAVFQEIYRVLKPGGHFSISDIVLIGELPAALKQDAEMYAGCVAGAIQKTDDLDMVGNSGFVNLNIQQEKPIAIPDDILLNHLSLQELTQFKTGKTGIFSVTIFAEKSPIF